MAPLCCKQYVKQCNKLQEKLQSTLLNKLENTEYVNNDDDVDDVDDDEEGAAAYFFFWSETAMAISTVNYKRVDPVGFYAAVCHRL